MSFRPKSILQSLKSWLWLLYFTDYFLHWPPSNSVSKDVMNYLYYQDVDEKIMGNFSYILGYLEGSGAKSQMWKGFSFFKKEYEECLNHI
jgi:hypothetical protein